MASSPTIETIEAAIKSELLKVRKSAGRVHIRERQLLRWEEFQDAVKDDDGTQRTTIVVYTGNQEREDAALFRYHVFHQFDLFHYLQHNDQESSEQGFRKEIEAIRNQFRGNAAVFGVPLNPEAQRTITDVLIEIAEFSDKLVHRAVMSLTVEAREVL